MEDPLRVQKIKEKKKESTKIRSASKPSLVPRVASLSTRPTSVESKSKIDKKPTISGKLSTSQLNKKESPATQGEIPKTTEVPVEELKPKFVYVAPKLDTEHNNNWVSLSLRCISWRYVHFNLEVPVDTPIELLRQKIIEHHAGAIGTVVMFKGKVSKENLLPFASSKNLLQCGIKGGKIEEKVQQIIYYDFEAFHSDDPVLNYKPRHR